MRERRSHLDAAAPSRWSARTRLPSRQKLRFDKRTRRNRIGQASDFPRSSARAILKSVRIALLRHSSASGVRPGSGVSGKTSLQLTVEKSCEDTWHSLVGCAGVEGRSA